MAAGTPEQCQVLVEHNVVPLFLELLKNTYDLLVERAIWGIANLATDLPNRDIILMEGADKLIS